VISVEDGRRKIDRRGGCGGIGKRRAGKAQRVRAIVVSVVTGRHQHWKRI
jgi:hypothetical protein